jgi:hypothetical protein
MPAGQIKSFAKKSGKSEAEVEKLWDKAKELAADQGHKDDYDYVAGILKKMLKLEDTQTGDVAKPDVPLAAPVEPRCPDGHGPYGCPYFDVEDSATFNKMLDRRAKGEHWKKIIQDPGIRQWIKGNRLKNFYLKLKHHDVYVKATDSKTPPKPKF